MTSYKRATNLAEDRAVMRTTREVVVGAFGRRQRRWHIFVGAIGLLLIGGAVALYFALRPEDMDHGPGGRQVAWECAQCGLRGVTIIRDESAFPLTCPKCNVRSCHPLWECRRCGHRFLNKGGEAELTCPQCQSQSVGSADPNETPPARP